MAALDYEKEQFYKKYGAPGPGQELVGMKNNKAIYRDIESATPPAAQQPAQTAAPKSAQPAQPAAKQPAQPAQTEAQQPAQTAMDYPGHFAAQELPVVRLEAPKSAQPTQPAAKQPAQPAQPSAKQPAQPAQPSAKQPAQTGPQYSSDPELAAAQRRMQELSRRRDQEFQNNPDITDSARTPRTTSFFNSKEYAQQFREAQAAANQRAIDRIGAPRQDRGISTTLESTNRGAAALRNAAKQPRVATAEQVRAAGFGPEQTKRLMFGVGEKGESINVTPDYLERLRKRGLRNY